MAYEFRLPRVFRALVPQHRRDEQGRPAAEGGLPARNNNNPAPPRQGGGFIRQIFHRAGGQAQTVPPPAPLPYRIEQRWTPPVLEDDAVNLLGQIDAAARLGSQKALDEERQRAQAQALQRRQQREALDAAFAKLAKHEDLPPPRTVVTISSQPPVLRDFENVLLGKRVVDQRKQYVLGWENLYDSYPKPPGAATSAEGSAAGGRRFIGEGHTYEVHARRNPEATVYRKQAKTAGHEDAAINARCTLLNAIHLLLQEPDAAPYKGHFAVEVFKLAGEEKRPVFLTPIVNGFTLTDYLSDPPRYRDRLPPGRLPALVDELKQAMHWLAGQGYVHNDIHRGNVMFDEAHGRLVLIDFGMADRAGPNMSLGYDVYCLERYCLNEVLEHPALAGGN
jgi:hypothetical protein